MRRALLLLLLLFTFGCPNQVEPVDAGMDATPDAGADSGVDAGEDAGRDTGVNPDAGDDDAGIEDASLDAGRVIPIRVAFSATAEMPLLAELYLTESSTTRHKVTPVLAGGPPIDGKGDPFISGVKEFHWTDDGAIVYSAHQDNFDVYELYYAPDPGSRPTFRQSLPNATTSIDYFERSPASEWIAFGQQASQGAPLFMWAVRTSTAPAPVQLTFGTVVLPFWSPAGPELVYQDILGMNDRDLWHANLAVSPPVMTRVNAGANLGFGSTASWAPDGSHVVYSADETALRLFEPYRVTITGGILGARERLTPPFPVDADVVGLDNIAHAPAGSLVAYFADADTDNVDDLYVLDPSLPAPIAPTRLTTAFPPGAGGVERFSFSADGTRIAYAADHDTPGLLELYITSTVTAGGVRVHSPLLAGQSIEHERFIRADTMLLYTVYDGVERRLFVVDVSQAPFGSPVDLGPIRPFFPFAQYALSPSQDWVIHPSDDPPARLYLSRLTGTPTTTLVLPTFDDGRFYFDHVRWCWSPRDELSIVGTDGHLYLVEDLTTGALFDVSGPIVEGGRVINCAFP